MTKDQKRGNREAKKPKAEKPVVAQPVPAKGLSPSQGTASKAKR